MAKTSNQPAPYQWRLGASRYFQCLVATIALCLCGFVWSQLALLLASVFTGLVLVLTWVSARTHHALMGPIVSLQLNSGQLALLKAQKDSSRLAMPLTLTECRWLGKKVLVASCRVEGRRHKPLNLLLTPDNSNHQDRHRLAMFYHSGVAA